MKTVIRLFVLIIGLTPFAVLASADTAQQENAVVVHDSVHDAEQQRQSVQPIDTIAALKMLLKQQSHPTGRSEDVAKVGEDVDTQKTIKVLEQLKSMTTPK